MRTDNDNINSIVSRYLERKTVADVEQEVNLLKALVDPDDLDRDFLFDFYLRSRVCSINNKHGFYSIIGGKYVNVDQVDNGILFTVLKDSATDKINKTQKFIDRVKTKSEENCPGQLKWKQDGTGQFLDETEQEPSKEEILNLLEEMQERTA